EEPEEPAAPARPPHQAAGFDAVDAGDLETAKAEFTQALKDNPGDEESQKMLAQVELVERVREVTDPVALMQQAQAAGLDDVPTQLSAADVECYNRRPEAAFQRLIDVISVTSGQDRETARKRLLELFEIVGSDNPAVGQARKALAMALFS
ncbi:MAG: tetratricopeptide repeat protein, partial [Ancrocorticia populi]